MILLALWLVCSPRTLEGSSMASGLETVVGLKGWLVLLLTCEKVVISMILVMMMKRGRRGGCDGGRKR